MIYGRGYSRDPVDRLTDRVETRATGQHRGATSFGSRRPVSGPDDSARAKRLIGSEE